MVGGLDAGYPEISHFEQLVPGLNGLFAIQALVGSFLELHAAGKSQIAPSISHSHSLEGDTPIAAF